MISVVCVYNNESILHSVLLRSLNNQNCAFDLITVDNRTRVFGSAAQALNHVGSRAKGDYVMFVHQDMWLGSPTWLEQAENIVRTISDLGVAGVTGQTREGKRWEDRCRRSTEPFDHAPGEMRAAGGYEEVQTLDECLLIVPRSVFEALKFDEDTFDGWHCYGADYCLSAALLGLKSYVISAGSCIHSNPRSSTEELLKYQFRLYRKHRKYHKQIYTIVTQSSSWLQLSLLWLAEILTKYYLKLSPDLPKRLNDALSDCSTVLDIGCGHRSVLAANRTLASKQLSVGVDISQPYLLESRRKHLHSLYVRADVTRLNFKPKSFDAVVAIHLLEYLPKEDGVQLLGKMDEWAKKKTLVITYNGSKTHGKWSDALQGQSSRWTSRELRTHGFDVRKLTRWVYYGASMGLLVRHAAMDLCQILTCQRANFAPRLLATKLSDHLSGTKAE